jgi:uncharacterized membrane protein
MRVLLIVLLILYQIIGEHKCEGRAKALATPILKTIIIMVVLLIYYSIASPNQFVTELLQLRIKLTLLN